MFRVPDRGFKLGVGEELLAVKGVSGVFFEIQRTGFQMDEVVVLLIPSFAGEGNLTVFLREVDGVMVFEAVEDMFKVDCFTRNVQTCGDDGYQVVELGSLELERRFLHLRVNRELFST